MQLILVFVGTGFILNKIYSLKYNFLIKSFVSQKEKYRLTAGIVLTCAGRIFCGLDPRHGNWTMPQGGVGPGEPVNEAAARELLEETGIAEVNWLNSSDWYILSLPDFIKRSERYKTINMQKYKWFLASVESEPKIKLNYEYIDYEWLYPKELISRTQGYFKQEMYIKILQHFHLIS